MKTYTREQAYTHLMECLKKNVSTLDEEISTKLMININSLDGLHNDLNAKIGLLAGCSTLNEETFNETREENLKLRKKVAEQDAIIIEYPPILTELNEQIKKLKEEYEELKEWNESNEEFKEENEELKEENEELMKENEELKEENEEIMDLKETNKDMNAIIEDYPTVIHKLNKENEAYKKFFDKKNCSWEYELEEQRLKKENEELRKKSRTTSLNVRLTDHFSKPQHPTHMPLEQSWHLMKSLKEENEILKNENHNIKMGTISLVSELETINKEL
jgi:chromosome segregation ATPase